MKKIPFASTLFTAVVLLSFQSQSFAQAPSAASAPHRETTQDLIAKLNPQQKQYFDNAGKAYGEHRYADSLAIHQLLLKDFPSDPILLKFASEAALNGGDATFAMKTLKPLVQADLDDWQAAAMLVRACAETGDTVCRDAGMAHMLDLHRRGVTPPKLLEYVVEIVRVGTGSLEIQTSLEPWGRYKVYNHGKLTDASGKLFLTISIESGDFDQPLFAQQHPEVAAKGIRLFSMDGYQETGANANGQRTQTHMTFKFFEGQPSYATVREEFLKVANGKAEAMSNRTGLIVP